jgi:hypothetical protein
MLYTYANLEIEKDEFSVKIIKSKMEVTLKLKIVVNFF